ncbi:transcriptional regulator [Paractinoplanes rishiriensis]|uniref:Transcriptional regulator n=1 Tax=Paractinoplanes rishiriensis TaxID=1050105 RepID=A0A919JT12_9ACTN|nr:transcriptional regulator [Actinoplanes rishiriensis]
MEYAETWPLIGRDDELKAAATALTSGGLVLTGQPGVGRTRLAGEVLRRWVATGGEHEWVTATRTAAAEPLAAVSHLLPAGLRAGQLPAVLAAAAARFARRPGPVLVGVDDAHLLDDASATLLHHLAARRLATLVVTVRDGEPVPDAVRPLCTGTRIETGPLPPPAARRLLSAALGGPVDPISARRLVRLAAGNPLLLRELLTDTLEGGELDRTEGCWHWTGRVPAGRRLTGTITSRLRTLPADVRAVLELVAAAEPLILARAEQVTGPAAIEAAERSGLAVADRDGTRSRLRLAQPLAGVVLRAGLPAGRATAIRRDLTGTHGSGPVRLHDDVLLAGVRHRGLLMAAARRAVARFDLAPAERLAAAARDAGHPAADWLLAEILLLRGRSAEAAAVLPTVPPRTPGQDVTGGLVRYWGLNRVVEAERALHGGHPLTRATRSWLLLFDGHCHDALTTAESVAGPALPPAAGRPALLRAAAAGALAAGLLGRRARAGELAAAGAAAAGDDPWGRALAGFGLCAARLVAGEPAAAGSLAEDGHRAAVFAEAPALAGVWAGLRGMAATAMGRPATGRAALREALVLLDGADPAHLSWVLLAELAGACALAGDTAEAAACLARSDEHRTAANRIFVAWAERNRAWVLAAGGSVPAAVRRVEHAARLARETQQPGLEVLCHYDAARLGAAHRARHRLRELAARLPDGFAGVLADAAGGLADRDPAVLERATAALAARGHTLLAAEVAVAALDAYRRAGRTDGTRRAAERAATLAGLCPGVRTPLLGGGATRGRAPAALTLREREVALLAPALPSREIAARLGLSVRTVDNVLGRVYQKLGIGGRAELSTILPATPVPARVPALSGRTPGHDD